MAVAVAEEKCCGLRVAGCLVLFILKDVFTDESISDLQLLLLRKTKETVMPTIQLDNCIKCNKCVKDCPADAINIELGTVAGNCIHCGHCVAICPESAVMPDVGEINPLQEHSISPADFVALSANVRTCRNYLNKPIEQQTLDALIDNMKNYPSASNARPVEINIISTPELVKTLNDKVADHLLKTFKFITSAVVKGILKLIAPKMDLSALKKYKERFIARRQAGISLVTYDAPSVMLFHAPASKLGMADSDALIWATYTTLYANTFGLGTCFNGFIVKAMARNKALKEEFGIPKNHVVHAALLLGYPKVKYLNEVNRVQPRIKHYPIKNPL